MSLDTLAIINDLAVGQWGLLTTRQAGREGVSRTQLARLADAGVLERVGQGIYSVTSSNDSFQALHAAWLSLDPGATAEERLSMGREAVVACHTSAAALHDMGDLPSDVPELNTSTRKQTARPMKLHRLSLTPEDVTLVDGLPTTTPERTVADLVRGGHDLSHVADAVRDGLRSGAVDPQKLRIQLDRVASRTGHGDGGELQEHLLDLAGLSAAAVARSEFGRTIATSAVRQYQAALADLLKPTMTDSMAELLRQHVSVTEPLSRHVSEVFKPNAALTAALVEPSSAFLEVLRDAVIPNNLQLIQAAFAQQPDLWKTALSMGTVPSEDHEQRKTKADD